MNSSRIYRENYIFILFIFVVTVLLLLASPYYSLAQNPNSDTTTTGQILTVNITTPEDGSTFPGPPPCEVNVDGLVTLSAVSDTTISILYVIDVSGSTADPFNFPPIDLNDDGKVDESDDFNGDGANGDILDAEIAGALALNASIHNLKAVNVGVVGYASRAANADVSPEADFQNFTSPPQADSQPNGTPDIEEVLRSLDSEIILGGSIDLFESISRDSLGNSSNFEAALQAIIAALQARPETEKSIVYFISDGKNEIGGSLDDELDQAVANSIVINSIGITQNSEPADLAVIAERTGGTFVQVDNPGELRVVLPTIPVIGISTVTVNGNEVSLSSVGTFATSLSLPGGANKILATATADDQTSVTASITVNCLDTLSCIVDIIAPLEGALVCSDNVQVTAVTRVSGGMPPITRECFLNGKSVVAVNDTIKAEIALAPGEKEIVVACIYTDAEQNQVTCADTVEVMRAVPPECMVEIVSPEDSAFVCADSVKVTAITTIGPIPAPYPKRVSLFTKQDSPISITCEINGVVATVLDSMFMATIPLESEENLIVATCTIVDSCGNEVVCEDSIRVFRPAPPICEVEIISPADSALVCSDSVKVTAVTDISGGTPPISITCEINAVMAEVSDAMFMATIPLESEENLIVATCTIVDSCGNEVVCEDSIRIFRPAAPICEVEIISPDDGAIVCEDSLKVTAFTNISVGSPPLTITCDINGITASVEDSLFMATIPLKSGENQIIATCTIENSCGSTTVCRDSITVFFDDIPPTCSFGQDGSSIKGTFFDEHSGIASIDPVYINNATLTVDPFSPGDRAVNFRADVKNPDGAIGFLIKVRDLCGNTFECDPIFLTLEADRDNRQFAFTFPNLDRYLQLSNYGLTEIRVDLNGQKFTLTSDPGRTQSEVNTYFVATDGTITIDLVDYLHEGENNMSIVYEGQSGTRAELFLLDSAQDVDFVLELQSLPVEFQLAQNYPNPFNPTTKIRFDIPEKITDGVQVQLRIYNLLGKLVRVLVDEHKFPGQYLAEWDARDETDAVVSSGIYIYQLTAGEFRKTRRMLLLK